jgi:hypothetical protein
VWAGWDSTWKRENIQAGKILENRAESHTSAARFVGLRHFSREFFYTEVSRPFSLFTLEALAFN